MISNYLKILWRQMRKYRWYSLINILGLCVGLVTCLFIFLYIQDELSYDRFYPDAENIYRLRMDEGDEGTYYPMANTYPILKPIVDNYIPGLDHVTRVLPWPMTVRSTEEQQFSEQQFILADSTFFDLFRLEFIHGDRTSALDPPNAVVFTASMARKYFGRTDVVGEVITVEESYLMQITGVVEDLPSNSSLRWDFAGNIESITTIEGDYVLRALHYPPVYTFASLQPGAQADSIEADVTATVKELAANAGVDRIYHLQPLRDIHLNTGLQNEPLPTTNPIYLYIFGVSGLLILILAGINFTNLATARALNRAREVGLRKTVGASRSQLVFQYISESVVYTLVAGCLAIVGVELLLPWFNAFTGKEVGLLFWTDPLIAGGFLAVVLLAGIAAGAYPAFFLSSVKPAQAFDATHGVRLRGGFSLRTSLLAFQFVISAVLVIGSLVINRQLHYVMESNLGFEKEHSLVIRMPVDEVQQEYTRFKQSVTVLAGVESATAISNFPWESGFYNFPATVSQGGETMDYNAPLLLVDEDFVETMQIEIVQGRDISGEYGMDADHSFLINESAARQLGWDNPLGARVTVNSVASGQPRSGEVVGIVEDFHFQSMYHTIDPLIIMVSPEAYYLDNMVVRLSPGNIREQVDQLAAAWNEVAPNRPFSYFFLEDAFDRLYNAEQRIATISNIFMGLALFIAGMGLFGIASINILRRTREIGIRKVYGASTANILKLISREYVMMVFLTNLIAWAIAWYLMSRWLENFAYRISFSPLYFVLTFAAILLITFISIGFQTVKAARLNPAESIRGE